MTIANNINNKIEQVRLIDPTRKSEDIVRTRILPEPYKGGRTILYFNNCIARLIGANGETLEEKEISESGANFIRKNLQEASKDESEKLRHNSEVNRLIDSQIQKYRD